jgi:hypothetical protein
MANAEAYRVLRDTSLPRPVRTATTLEGVVLQETMGQAYAEGDYLFREELTDSDQERVDSGELDGFLEAVDRDEAVAARTSVDTGLFIPEHEAERYALIEAGHRVVEKDQLLELKAAGGEAAREFLEQSRKGPNDANPEITEQESFVEVPSLADVSRGDAEPSDVEHGNEPIVPAEVETEVSSSAAGVEQPPGLPVGPTLAKAAGADPEKVDKAAAKAPARRSRPGGSSSSSKGDGDK